MHVCRQTLAFIALPVFLAFAMHALALEFWVAFTKQGLPAFPVCISLKQSQAVQNTLDSLIATCHSCCRLH